MGGFLGGVKSFAGDFVNLHAHAVGDALDFVGMHDAAHTVDKWGDGVADDLGAAVGELNLGESDDPKELVHGDVKAIGETIQHLQKFNLAFEEVAAGMSRMDAAHWQGQAADAFRAKFSTQPVAWRVTADACEAAGKALAALGGTISWAQAQAQQAIDTYRKSEQATRDAQNAYNRQADDFNRAVKAYNTAAQAGQNPTPPTRPAEFHDPGAAGRKQAAELLLEARKQRVSAAQAAEKAIRAATGAAPKAPGLMDRVGTALLDAPDMIGATALHIEGGVVKGGADLLKFVRGVNPMDPYNLTHPALYLDHLNSVAGGLAYTGNHPMELAKSLVGSGWGSDPGEAGGKAFFNLISGLGTGGGSEAAAVAERVAINAAERAAQRTAVHAAENAAERGAVEAAEKSAQKAAAGVVDHPPFNPSNPAGLPDGWTIKPPESSAEQAAGAAKSVPEPVHTPAPEPKPFHPAEHGNGDLAAYAHGGDEAAAGAKVHEPGGEAPGGHGHPADDGAAGHPPAEQPGAAAHEAPPAHDGATPAESGPGHDAPGDHTAPDHTPADGAGHSPGPDGPMSPDDFTKLPLDEQMRVAESEISGGARTFADNAEAKQYGADYWNDKVGELSAEQKTALRDYTCASKYEADTVSYQEINGELRAKGPLSDEVAAHVKELDSALAAHPIPEDIIVARGTGLEHVKMEPQDMVGKVFDEDAYSSASLGEAAFDSKPAILHLRVPEGTPAIWVEKVGAYGAGERELLLGRDMQWRATRAVKSGGQWHIYGEVL
ncbi:putative T7SS-secreted protein [Kitasatospora sp. NPDC057015]|uniref:putative T7SS-secreted protein n=1 Tax=Kitasatospora sp. NPDC057015 TaxID=3346001 RepID=UPI00363E7725